MSRRPGPAVVTNPVLVGAATALVVVVAVFLAYNANQGLPFAPSRHIAFDLPNGAELTKGSEVREGGHLVGFLTSLRPVRLPDGSIGARAQLKLTRSIGRIPPDTRIVVRPKSVLGLKYVELERGHARGDVPEGHVFGVGHAGASVDLDTLFDTFDRPTRVGMRRTVRGLGDALTSRGADLNQAIRLLPPALGHLRPVMATLADPRTDLRGLVRGLARAVGQLAPVAGANARLFSSMADTFGALVADPRALEETIARTPPALQVGTRSLRAQRPFLRHTAALSTDLARAAGELRAGLPTLDAAVREGAGPLRRSTALSERTGATLDDLRDLAAASGTPPALRALIATTGSVRHHLRFLGPFVTVCNYWNYVWTGAAAHLSQPDAGGTAERVLLGSAGLQDDAVTAMGAYIPANGLGFVEATRAFGDPQFLHGQPYGAAIDAHGAADCENGQRGYPRRLPMPGTPAGFYIASRPHTPGDQGPTYRGRRGVLAGQTFDRNPFGQPELP